MMRASDAGRSRSCAPVTIQEPLASGSLPSTHHVRVRDAERGRPRDRLRVRSGPVLDHEQRGEPVAAGDAEGARVEREALDRLGIERAHQPLQAVGVRDLDAVHHGEVLVGTAATHREPAGELVGPGDAGQHLEHAEHVVDGAGRGQDLHGADGERRGRRRRLRLGLDVHPLLEAELGSERHEHLALLAGDDRHGLRDVPGRGHLQGGSSAGHVQAKGPVGDPSWRRECRRRHAPRRWRSRFGRRRRDRRWSLPRRAQSGRRRGARRAGRRRPERPEATQIASRNVMLPVRACDRDISPPLSRVVAAPAPTRRYLRGGPAAMRARVAWRSPSP